MNIATELAHAVLYMEDEIIRLRSEAAPNIPVRALSVITNPVEVPGDLVKQLSLWIESLERDGYMDLVETLTECRRIITAIQQGAGK